MGYNNNEPLATDMVNDCITRARAYTMGTYIYRQELPLDVFNRVISIINVDINKYLDNHDNEYVFWKPVTSRLKRC